MHSRFLKYSCILPILLFISCGDSGQPEQKAADTIQAGVTPSSAINDPYAVMPQELSDDSVFNDGSRPSSWKDAGINDSIGVKAFVRKLQVWVRDNQVDSISSYLQYPLKNPGIKDAKDFKLNYGNYITEGVKAAVADQKLSQIFRNQQGAMLGQGQVWLREENNKISIFAINN